LLQEYEKKLKILGMLNQDVFIEVRKKTEEELIAIFGRECGRLLAAEAICEENFVNKNQKMDNRMEHLDSENFDNREKREARMNAGAIKS
jgi:hypothetical protein